MPAVLFGSISTIADTSELQRQAFNEAFAAHGLDWDWDRDTYVAMLGESGGRDRIARYAERRGEEVDADAVHATKSERFQRGLAGSGVAPREGVAETVREAKDRGIKVGLVTTTSEANVASLMQALRPTLDTTDFDVVVDASSVAEPKPDRAAYRFALEALGEPADACVAIEDNPGGVEAAVAAGVRCVAFPNRNTGGQDFGRAERTVDRIALAELEPLTAAG